MTVAADETLDTLLVFLATSCTQCAAHWDMLSSLPGTLPLGTRACVITPSPAMEDVARARRLVPTGVGLHMGSETWFMYGVGQAGTIALVRSPRLGPGPWESPGEVLGSTYLTDPEDLAAVLRRWLEKHPKG